MTTDTRFTCQQIAAKWLNAATREAAQAYCAVRAKTSARRRWANLNAAMAAGDALRVQAYASEGGAPKKEAWAKVRVGDVPAPKAKAPTPRARETARAAASAVRAATGVDPIAEAARLLGIDPAALAAFTQLVGHAPAPTAKAGATRRSPGQRASVARRRAR